MKALAHSKLILFALIPLLQMTHANAFFCLSSKKNLSKIHQKLEKNFYFNDGTARDKGPQFGLSERKLNTLINKIQLCHNKIDDMGLTQCLSNDILPVLKVAYKKSKAKGKYREGNSLAFEVSDKNYFKNMPKDATVLPDELKNGLPDNWREIVKKNENWTGIQYSSRTVANPPGPNRSRERVLLLIKEPPYERWIQFTTTQPCRPGESISTGGGYSNTLCDNNGVYRVIPIARSCNKEKGRHCKPLCKTR